MAPPWAACSPSVSMAMVLLPEDVQVAFGIGLLEELAALGGGRDGIKDAGVGDARLGVVGDQLVSVGGNPNAGIASSSRHKSLSVSSLFQVKSSGVRWEAESTVGLRTV